MHFLEQYLSWDWIQNEPATDVDVVSETYSERYHEKAQLFIC